jgi:superoxide dismutase, Fe-Mn family
MEQPNSHWSKRIMMTRRQALKTGAFALAATTLSPWVGAQSIIDGRFMPLFRLPPLPYAADALEPEIDARTMLIHHDSVHASYVGQLNNAVSSIPDFYFEVKEKGTDQESVAKLITNLDSVPKQIRGSVKDNAGGHFNHSLFWQLMKGGGRSNPTGELLNAIQKNFGGVDQFKDEFSKSALALFSNGWTWLSIDGDRLRIENLPNEDSPLSLGRQVLLGIDLWEHAYYLKYQNDRGGYVSAWFNVINWDYVSARYTSLRRQ